MTERPDLERFIKAWTGCGQHEARSLINGLSLYGYQVTEIVGHDAEERRRYVNKILLIREATAARAGAQARGGDGALSAPSPADASP